MRRILPPTLFLLLSGAMAGLGFGIPGPRTQPMIPAGLLLLVGGLGLASMGSRLFARRKTNIMTFDDPDRLVDEGPFALSRNPMYLGLLLGLVGLALLLGSPWAAVGPVLFFLACERVYIPFEEARMAATFGPAYDRYRSRVRRWFGRRRDPEA